MGHTVKSYEDNIRRNIIGRRKKSIQSKEDFDKETTELLKKHNVYRGNKNVDV